MRDYYQILGVSRNATTEEIKKAYRRLAKRYHPDSAHSRESDKRRFHEITEAYKVLSDPETRRRYNSWGHETYVRTKGQTTWEAWEYAHSHAHDHEDGHCGACGGHGHDHEDGHCGACGGHGHDHSHEDGHCGACDEHRHAAKEEEGPPPKSVRTSVHLTYQETLTGADKWVDLVLDNGTKRRVHIRIPRRTYEHCYYVLDDVIFDDEEEVLQKNIVVIVLLDDQPGFERQSCHLYSTKKVDFVDMVLGGVVMIETIDGEIPFEIKPGTQNGARVRLEGRGLWMPPKVGNRGDHYVTFEVEIPRELNPGQIAALRAFRMAGGTHEKVI